MKKKGFTLTGLFLGLIMLVAQPLFSGGSTESAAEKAEEYTVFCETDILLPWVNGFEEDVVTPYFEEKFNLKIKEVFWRQGMQDVMQRLNQFIATDSLPDVNMVSRGNQAYLLQNEMLKELTDFVRIEMPTYWSMLTEEERKVAEDDGKLYLVYKLTPSVHDNLDDPHNSDFAHAPLIREDILTMLGYEFTPMKEVVEICELEQRAPTMEDIEIKPAIETPDDFLALLRKIQDLNLTADGKPLIPWSVRWSIFHFGGMYDLGHWMWNPRNKEAQGYLGTEHAKDYFQFINTCYREGLLDPEFASQQNPQIMEKASRGRLGVIMSDVPDLLTVHEALADIDPSMVYHPFPWPEEDPDLHGYMDVVVPGFHVVCISDKTDEGLVTRLMQMWDWMYTDEGWDTLVWGPASTGIWEWKDGKRFFSDPNVWKAELSAAESGGPKDFGLQSDNVKHKYGDFWSQIANLSGGPDKGYPRNISKSYPPEFTFMTVFNQARRICGHSHFASGVEASYGAGEASSYANKYYWSDFRNKDIVKLLTPSTFADFDAAWDEIVQANETKGRYTEGKEAMTEWFKAMGME
jgi:hypothetical protein